MAVDNSKKQQGLNIDFDKLLGGSDQNEPVPNVVVVRTDKSRRSRPPDEKPVISPFEDTSDRDLEAQIKRMSEQLPSMVAKLVDRGEKFKKRLQDAKDEWDRRLRRRAQQDAAGFKNSVPSEGSRVNGVIDRPKQAPSLSQPSQMSQFASIFTKKLDDDAKPDSQQNATGKLKVAFGDELGYLNPCDKRKRKVGGKLSPRKAAKPDLVSKEFRSWEHTNGSYKGVKYGRLNGNLSSRALSQEKPPGSSAKDDSKGLSSKGLENDKTVVLVDEDDSELIEQEEETDEPSSRMNEGKIYYPCREDPQSLEIFRSELKCLQPGECLTSTIMNFYIRFLQERCSTDDRSHQSLYFFNTYFYNKLQEAMARQKNEKEAYFNKFRRWWRGVNLFQKAYIFLPVNEDNHWSLVIICILDEDDSGLIILHLDSLGLHSSNTIFLNVKSLLTNEWEYMREDGDVVDVPISDRIWRNLPRRIYDKIITVPRQTNDYDCGLFVLYYIERFIEDAPKRLKREHLSMFGKDWFRPRDASSLRGEIKKILQEEFKKASREDNTLWKPVQLSADAETPAHADGVSV